MNLFSIITFLLCSCCLTIAQNGFGQFVQAIHPPVTFNNNQLSLAWLGGLNNVQLSSVDANDDGIMDIFLYDRTSENSFIITCDVNGSIVEQNKIQENNIPKLREWALMRDYNCDGLPDIFSYGNGGIKIHKNIGTSTSWDFELITNDLQSFSDFGNNSYFSSLYVSSVDLPLIEDLDNDGDLDVLTFGLNGDKLEFHKNLSIEFNNTCDSLHFALKNRCWGYIEEANFDNTLTLESTNCPFNVINPEKRKRYPTTTEYPKQQFVTSRHSGSTITNISVANNLSTILIGDVSYNSLTELTIVNNSINRDSVVNATYNFPPSTPIDLTTFPAGFVINRNNLGNELIISPFGLSGTANQQSLWRYTYSNNQWNLSEKDFIQNQTIDVGSDAIPVWHDINRDGVMDIIIGSGNNFKLDNNYGSLTLLLNIGTNSNPSFNITDTNFLNLNSLSLENLYPAFGDLTGDNRDELIVGTKDGFLLYYTNNANAIEEFTLNQTQLTDNNNEVIDVGLFATPCLIDINDDNLLDLIIGNRNGKLTYYENIGNKTSPSFRLIDNNYGNINVTPALELNGYSAPSVSFINNSTLLSVGNSEGDFFWFDSLNENSVTPNQAYPSSLKTGRRSTLATYTVGNSLHTLIGNKGGGLNYFIIDLNKLSILEKQKNNISIFPNPTNNTFTIKGQAANSLLTLLNVAGKIMLTKQLSAKEENIDISNLANGIYFANITGQMSPIVIKIVKQ